LIIVVSFNLLTAGGCSCVADARQEPASRGAQMAGCAGQRDKRVQEHDRPFRFSLLMPR
jgi:hypothetical protein